jgi:tetratricopeptide (TPR) repeat protein
MKAERRHELKHNELADWLGERMEAVQPHATAIALGAVLLFAAVIGGIRYFGAEDTVAAKGWSKYFSAINDREPTKILEGVASQHAGTHAALWAHQALGDMQLGQGAALLHSDRIEAQKLLKKAESEYKQIENTADPLLKARARLGLAKVYESLCQPEEARKYYELAAQASDSAAIKKAAAADAERLKDPRQVAFLEWFAKQQPKRPAPLPGPGGSLPGLSNLPDRPDIGLPPGLGLDTIGGPLPGERGAAFPPPAGTPPAGTPPSGDSTDKAAPNTAEPPAKSEAAPVPEPKAGDEKTPAAKPE